MFCNVLCKLIEKLSVEVLTISKDGFSAGEYAKTW